MAMLEVFYCIKVRNQNQVDTSREQKSTDLNLLCLRSLIFPTLFIAFFCSFKSFLDQLRAP